MSYIEKNLLPGESVVYRAHLHPVIYVQSSLFALIGLAFVVFDLVTTALSYFWLLGAVFLLYAAAIGAYHAVRSASSEFAVTNKRVVIKVGFIKRKTLEMVLTKVETIRVDQSILGRMLGYGTIVVTGTGGTSEPFAALASPLEFRRQVQALTSG